MKKLFLLISLLLLSVHLTSCNQGDRVEDGPFYLAENGITIKAKDSVLVGTKAMFKEITYTLVNDSLIREISGQGWNDNSFINDSCQIVTTLVTDMSELFFNGISFNQDIGNWDVSNLTDMEGMFIDASSFNQDIGNWDVSNVTNMIGMFSQSQFNGDISKWDVSNVNNMSRMFYESQFNGDISKWDVSNVTKERVLVDFLVFKLLLEDGSVYPFNTSMLSMMQGLSQEDNNKNKSEDDLVNEQLEKMAYKYGLDVQELKDAQKKAIRTRRDFGSLKVYDKNGLFSGVAIDFWPNDKLRLEMNIKNGQWDGEVIFYHQNGQFASKSYWSKGIELSQKVFYKNGQLKTETYYESGKEIGVQKNYYIDGTPKSNQDYSDFRELKFLGKHDIVNYDLKSEIVLSKTIIDTSKTRTAIHRESDELTWEEYTEEVNGRTLYYSTPYYNGSLFTGVTFYTRIDNDGGEWNKDREIFEYPEKRYESSYKDGETELYRFWHPNGQLLHLSNKKNSKENGFTNSWFSNGQMKFEGFYKDGKRDGLFKEWHENGQIRSLESYKDGKQSGEAIYWYQNGQKQVVKYYKNDEGIGILESWYQDGQIKIRGKYVGGVLLRY